MDDPIEYRIPSDVLFAIDIGRKEKLLFAYFYTYHLRYKIGCTASNVQLSYIIGTDKNKISKSIKKLKDNNYINIEYKNRTPTNIKREQEGVATYFRKNKNNQFHNIVRTIYIAEKYAQIRRRKRK